MRGFPFCRALVPMVSFALLASCSSSHQGTPSVDAGVADGRADGAADARSEGAAPAQWDQPVVRPDDSTARASRATCKYTRGAMAAATLGKGSPVDADIPIENVVVLMMENHSFDSYLGHLNQYASRTDVESAAETASNPDATGAPQPWSHAPHACTLDTNHEWAGTHQEIAGGQMTGFVRANQDYNKMALPASSTDPSLWSGARAMGWYDQRDIPLYYKLASTFAIADHYHASVPGPTFPNRMFLYAATSFGWTYNDLSKRPDLHAYPFPGQDATVLDELEKRHTTWMYYGDGGLTSVSILYGGAVNTRWGRKVTGSFAEFQQAAQKGTLPQVSFVDPNMVSELMAADALDEHPPGDVQSGQKFVSDVVHAVMSSPQWAHTALFVTHDEHGGFYDHVPPPPACRPDAIAPLLTAGDTTPGGFDLYGVRVLLIAVSPYAKKGYVGHHVYDHTSIARFIEAKFKIPALTARDANAEPPFDLFDFSAPPAFLTPPTIDVPVIDPAELSYCETTFGQQATLGN
jgi:phospholipase C